MQIEKEEKKYSIDSSFEHYKKASLQFFFTYFFQSS